MRSLQRPRLATLRTMTPGIGYSGKGSCSSPPVPGRRIPIHHPRRNLQIKFTPSVPERNDFVAYMDSIGKVEWTHCLIEWNTAASQHSEQLVGRLALDPQLVCYS